MEKTTNDSADEQEARWGTNTWERLEDLQRGPGGFEGPALYLTERAYRLLTWSPKGEDSPAPVWYRDLQLSWIANQVNKQYEGGTQPLISYLVNFDKNGVAGKIHLVVSREKVGDGFVLVIRESPRR